MKHTSGVKPNLGFIRIFGCKAEVAVPQELRQKISWNAKLSDCILIRYFQTENLYELWDVVKETIIRARDVVFWEHKMGADLLRKWKLPNGLSILLVAAQYADNYTENNEVPATDLEIPV